MSSSDLILLFDNMSVEICPDDPCPSWCTASHSDLSRRNIQSVHYICHIKLFLMNVILFYT